MRIGITNAVISNSGDGAILHGIVTSLKDQGVCTDQDIVVFDSNAAETARLYPQWRVLQQLTVPTSSSNSLLARVVKRGHKLLTQAIAKNPRIGTALLVRGPLRSTTLGTAFQELLRCDVIVGTGGTYLVDHYDFDNKVTELEVAHAIGKPVYLWTQSMGPFRSDRARNSVRRLSGLASGVFFRDAKSQDYWMGVNEAPPVSAVVPDVAFVLPAPGPVTPSPHSPLALISVREWQHQGAEGGDYDPETYRRAVRTFAERLLSRGWRVTAVSTCQGVPSYGVDDSRLAAEIFAGLDVHIDTDHHVPEDLQRLIQTADLVLTTRMHLAILSLVGGVPTLAVAYEFKTVELFRSLGLADNVVSLEEIDASWVDAQVAGLDHQRRPATLSDTALTDLRQRAATPARESVGTLVGSTVSGLSA